MGPWLGRVARKWPPRAVAATLCVAAAFSLVPGSAAAASLVDLSLSWAPAEPASCRVWDGQSTNPLQWNLSLAMNGTDSSLQTTPTYVFINDSTIPARLQGWVFLLAAASPSGGNTSAYDDSRSKTQAFGTGAYGPPVSGETMELALYSASKSPPADPANITILLAPAASARTETYRFNVTAVTNRAGVSPPVVRTVELCVVVPAAYSYRMGTTATGTVPLDTNSSSVLDFWLMNDGLEADSYLCGISVEGGNLTAGFASGVDSQNQTGASPGGNLTLQVQVAVPPTAEGGTTSSVTLTCASQGGASNASGIQVALQVRTLRAVCFVPPGPPTAIALPGDRVSFNFAVQNGGNVGDTALVILVAGDGSWTLLVTPDTFELAAFGPGSTAGGQFVVDVPPDTPISTYEFRLRVDTSPASGGCEAAFRISVRQLFAVSVTQPPARVAAAGDEVQFSFTIRNDGNGLDSLQLLYYNSSGWRVFLDPPLSQKILRPSESAAFVATVLVPASPPPLAGEYVTVVEVTSVYATDEGRTVQATSKLTVLVGVLCTADIAASPTSMDANPAETPGGSAPRTFSLTVENGGNRQETFALLARASGFIVLITPTEISVEPGSSGTAVVEFVAPPSTLSGTYLIEVTATASCGPPLELESAVEVAVFRIDAAVSAGGNVSVHDPGDPGGAWTPTSGTELAMQEGFYLRFEVEVPNGGDRPIPQGALSVVVSDSLDCAGSDFDPLPEACSPQTLIVWSPAADIPVGSVLTFTIEYTAPAWVCLQVPGCATLAVNSHRISVTLLLEGQSDTANDEFGFQVIVTPKRTGPGPGPGPGAGNNTTGSPPATNGTGANQTEEPPDAAPAFLGAGGELAVLVAAAWVAAAVVARRPRGGRSEPPRRR